jgi:hypothetical protein
MARMVGFISRHGELSSRLMTVYGMKVFNPVMRLILFFLDLYAVITSTELQSPRATLHWYSAADLYS